MKMILKMFVFPLLLIVMFLHLLVKLAMNLSSYVIGFFLLLIAGCGIYSLLHTQWLNIAILAGMGLAALLVLFFAVSVEMALEDAAGAMREFLF